jgi:hypothetical protein
MEVPTGDWHWQQTATGSEFVTAAPLPVSFWLACQGARGAGVGVGAGASGEGRGGGGVHDARHSPAASHGPAGPSRRARDAAAAQPGAHPAAADTGIGMPKEPVVASERTIALAKRVKEVKVRGCTLAHTCALVPGAPPASGRGPARAGARAYRVHTITASCMIQVHVQLLQLTASSSKYRDLS